MELEKRFKDLDTHFQRFNEVDTRLNEVTQTLSTLGDVVRQVTATQEAVSSPLGFPYRFTYFLIFKHRVSSRS